MTGCDGNVDRADIGRVSGAHPLHRSGEEIGRYGGTTVTEPPAHTDRTSDTLATG